jgi:ubiquinol-cytochrome c reductase iron-sulfur subunit
MIKLPSRRRFLIASTTTLGVVGVGLAASSLIRSLYPNPTINPNKPLKIDTQHIPLGQAIQLKWQGQPVVIAHLTTEQLAFLNTHLDLLSDPQSQQLVDPDYIKPLQRSIQPNFIVLKGFCTYKPCLLVARPELAPIDLGQDWHGGWYCPCCGARFDMAGRIYKNNPQGTNLLIPPHYYADEHTLVIGEHSEFGVTQFTARTGTTQG